MTLAEIVAEGERQIGNYETMILPIGDARRLLAVAKAAVEWDAAEVEYQRAVAANGFRVRDQLRRSSRSESALVAMRAAVRGDAAASGEPEKGER